MSEQIIKKIFLGIWKGVYPIFGTVIINDDGSTLLRVEIPIKEGEKKNESNFIQQRDGEGLRQR